VSYQTHWTPPLYVFRLGDGLAEQLAAFLDTHPLTKLTVLDPTFRVSPIALSRMLKAHADYLRTRYGIDCRFTRHKTARLIELSRDIIVADCEAVRQDTLRLVGGSRPPEAGAADERSEAFGFGSLLPARPQGDSGEPESLLAKTESSRMGTAPNQSRQAGNGCISFSIPLVGTAVPNPARPSAEGR
jgi:hypothetical protein